MVGLFNNNTCVINVFHDYFRLTSTNVSPEIKKAGPSPVSWTFTPQKRITPKWNPKVHVCAHAGMCTCLFVQLVVICKNTENTIFCLLTSFSYLLSI